MNPTNTLAAASIDFWEVTAPVGPPIPPHYFCKPGHRQAQRRKWDRRGCQGGPDGGRYYRCIPAVRLGGHGYDSRQICIISLTRQSKSERRRLKRELSQTGKEAGKRAMHIAKTMGLASLASISGAV